MNEVSVNSERDAYAISLLRSYYAAMNCHDISRVIEFLDDNVYVTFPEEERNWRGRDRAIEKFGTMFEKLPSFVGDFDVEATELSDTHTLLHVDCSFSCKDSNYTNQRKMTYKIIGEKIVEICHL